MAEVRDQPRIVIAGLGLSTPLGFSAWQTFRALLAGRTIADRAISLPEGVNEVDLVRSLGCVSNVQHAPLDPAVELVEQVARQALEMANDSGIPGRSGVPGLSGGLGVLGNLERSFSEVSGTWLPGAGVPCVIGASKGAMHVLAKAMHVMSPSQTSAKAGGSGAADAHLAVALGPIGYLAHHLQRRLHVRHVQSIVAACASSLMALHTARLALLKDPRLRQILVVTCEASLLPLFVHSYRRLRVLPPLTREHYRGRPLDRGRCGFMLAEQAAAVVLRRVDHPGQIEPEQIELLDTAIASEAYDLVRPSPTMEAVGHVVGRLVKGRHIEMLHPHASGTVEHDPRELAVAAEAILGSRKPGVPDVYACKGALGHGLGAGGLVALVIACLCARTGNRPPMPWLSQPIDSPLRIAATPPESPPESPPATARASRSNRGCHVVVAAGFGGHVAGAVIRKTFINKKTDLAAPNGQVG